MTDQLFTGPHSTWEAEAKALRAENERLRAALEPFDEALGEDEGYIADSATVTMVWGPHHEYSLTLGDLRKARAALQEGEG